MNRSSSILNTLIIVIVLITIQTGYSMNKNEMPSQYFNMEEIPSQPTFNNWLKDHISSTYANAKLTNHGGWMQAHIDDLVISWAEWNEQGATLEGVHALTKGRTLFVEKSKMQNWKESSKVNHIDGAGYYITSYDPKKMSNWSVQNNTVIQFDADPDMFVKKMAQSWTAGSQSMKSNPDIRFVNWLKDYLPSKYSEAKIDDHGGWFQGFVSSDIVVSWAEWNEDNITLSGVHSLDQGEALFVEKTKRENWAENSAIKYYDGVGYFITSYDSINMAHWDVKGSTVAQLKGETWDFIAEMAHDYQRAKASLPTRISSVPKSEKPRVVLLTDIGGDRDDEQSFTRFMLYADQYDIEGLIATSIRIFPKEKHRPLNGEPQPHYLFNWINGYAQVRDNLMKHTSGWPEPDKLKSLIRKGVVTMRDAPFNIRTGKAEEGSQHYSLDKLIGKDKDTGASRLIIEVVDKDDPRPVWIPIWGGSVELAQALWRVRNDRSEDEVKKFVSKLRVYAWGHQDATGLWILENFPDLHYLVSTGGIIYSADASLQSKEWLDTHVRAGHGALGAICPIRWGKFGGADSETYLGLIQNGLSDMEHPDWGGWGGRLQKAEGSDKHWVDVEENLQKRTLGITIARWAPHFQNDYQARMDWCVNDFDDANHPPTPVLNGNKSFDPIEIDAKPGQRIELDASGSTDIDNDALNYNWMHFAKASTYMGEVEIKNADQMKTNIRVPRDAKGKTIHILLTLTDDGDPPLTRYRRLVINCK